MALLPHEEAVLVDERHGLVIDPFDILPGAFLVDRALGPVGFADDHFEGVLTPVEAVIPGPSVGRPPDAGDVLVGFGTRVDALLRAGREVRHPELDHRIAFPGLRVFERVGPVVELAVEAHHLHQRHFALVEAQVGDAAAVGREGVGARDAELLFVDPVGRAVDDLIPRSVVGDAARGLRGDVVDVEVVAVGVGDALSVGRERGVARRFGLPQHGLHAVVADERIGGGVGVAVDGFAPRGDEDRPLVGRKEVVADNQIGRGRREQALAGSIRGIAVTEYIVFFERGVVLAVGRGADAAHRFVQAAQAGDSGVFVLGVCCPGCQQQSGKNN